MLFVGTVLGSGGAERSQLAWSLSSPEPCSVRGLASAEQRHSVTREQPCQDVLVCEEAGQAHSDGSAGLLPCQPGRQCTGPRRSSSFALHDTLASSPELLIKMRLSAGSTRRDVASMEKRLYEQSIDVVLRALVDA